MKVARKTWQRLAQYGCHRRNCLYSASGFNMAAVDSVNNYQSIIYLPILFVSYTCLGISPFLLSSHINLEKKENLWTKDNLYIQIKFCEVIHTTVTQNAHLNSFSYPYF